MRNYKEFTINTDPASEEIISGLLWELNISGVNEEGTIIKVYATDDSEVNKNQIEEILQGLSKQGIIASYSVTEDTIADRNWNEEWEKTINVIEVSDRIVIKPSFREYQTEDPNKIILTIDPKMSFGTGEHQTTKLMIRMIERYVKPGMSVLDAGTGTGVLAIASVKLGAEHAVAFDNDEWCYENGIENCELNNESNRVQILNCELEAIEVKPFDLVLANINKNILIELAEGLRIRLAGDGILILSGLLDIDEEDIIKKFSSLGLKNVDKMQQDEWISLAFK